MTIDIKLFLHCRFLNIAGLRKCTNKALKPVLTSCATLEYLNIEELHLISDDCFHITEYLSTETPPLCCLHSLNLNYCSSLSGEAFIFLKKRISSLQELYVAGIHQLTDKSLQNLLEHTSIGGQQYGEKIRALSFRDCVNLTDQAIFALSIYCKMLEEIDLEGCIHLTDDGMKALSSSCSRLNTLSLKRCKKLTDVSLVHFSTYDLNIKNLNLSECNRFSDDGVEVLVIHMKDLLTLDISKCRKLTMSAITNIFKYCQDLKMLAATGMKDHFSLPLLEKAEKASIKLRL